MHKMYKESASRLVGNLLAVRYRFKRSMWLLHISRCTLILGSTTTSLLVLRGRVQAAPFDKQGTVLYLLWEIRVQDASTTRFMCLSRCIPWMSSIRRHAFSMRCTKKLIIRNSFMIVSSAIFRMPRSKHWLSRIIQIDHTLDVIHFLKARLSTVMRG